MNRRKSGPAKTRPAGSAPTPVQVHTYHQHMHSIDPLSSSPPLLSPPFFSLLRTFFLSPLLPPQDYKRMLDLIQANILSTDIAHHLRKMKDMTQMGTGQAWYSCHGNSELCAFQQKDWFLLVL